MQISIANAIQVARRIGAAAAEIITTNLKMWLGFETSVANQEKVVDGDFPTGTTAWTLTRSSISNNTAIIETTSGQLTSISQSVFAIGRTYLVSLDIANLVGEVEVNTTGGTSVGVFITTNGTKSFYFTPGGTDIEIKRKFGETIVYATISNVSVKEVNQITPDKSGNNNVGELFTGKALDFDGNNDYVSANSFAGTLSTGDAFTFAIWFNSSKPTTYRNFQNILISAGGPQVYTNIFKIGVNPAITADPISGKPPFGIYFDDSNGYNNQVPLSNGINYNDGEWHRLVVSRPSGSSNQSLTFYVDGSSIGTAPCNPSWSNMSAFEFGQEWDPNGRSDFFEGKMSDIQVYDYAWTTDDVSYDYANPQNLVTDRDGTSIELSNLKGYWALSEGAGSVAYDSVVELGADVVTDGDFPLPNVNWTIGNGTEITESGARVNNTGTGGIAFVKQFLNNSPLGKTFVLTYDVIATNGNLLVLQQASDLDLDTATIGANKKFTFSWSRTIDELTIKRKGGQATFTDVTIDNVALQETSVGIINGAIYEPAQPRIPQLGMMNWAKSTPESEEVTLIPSPNNISQDILGNAVRDRLNSFNLDGSGYAEVANSTSLSISNGTLQFWLKTTDTDFTILQGAVAKEYIGRTNNNAWSNGGTATISTFIDNAVSSSQPLYDNDWHFYTFTGIDINLWTEFSIGNETFDGLISDVLIYDGVLTSNQIKNNYNAGLSAHTND